MIKVWLIDKITKEKISVVFEAEIQEDAERFCEQWGWNYDDGHKSYWLEIEEE